MRSYRIANRDIHYLSKDDQETYENFMKKDLQELTEEDYEEVEAIIERLDHIIADMMEQ